MASFLLAGIILRPDHPRANENKKREKRSVDNINTPKYRRPGALQSPPCATRARSSSIGRPINKSALDVIAWWNSSDSSRSRNSRDSRVVIIRDGWEVLLKKARRTVVFAASRRERERESVDFSADILDKLSTARDSRRDIARGVPDDRKLCEGYRVTRMITARAINWTSHGS